jgi:selenide,water dikinase
VKRLVLIGAGHAHIEVLRSLVVEPLAGVEVTVVSPYPWFTYSGMVPGLIAGHYEIDELTVDLLPLCDVRGIQFVQSAAVRVDAAQRTVTAANGSSFGYDILSLDVGVQPAVDGARGVERHAVLVRPLERLVKGWSDVLVRARVGAIGHRLRQELGLAWAHVRLIADTPCIVPSFPAAARSALERKFARRNIGLHVGHAVTEVGPDYVRMEQGLEFASEAAFWATGGSAPAWLRESGLATVDDGYVLTDAFLRSVSHPEVFAAGDCQRSREAPRPPSGVFAVRAAPLLAANLRAALAGAPLRAFKTSPRFLSLMSTGNRSAVGVWNGFSFSGGWAWRWKDRIDRRFVARYRNARGVRSGR